MTSVQERLQLKREPLDKWSVREQLCLASAVARSGDQNWMSVSRALKPFGESNRPADWFHQKNCAAQYGALLGNVETPKRKKRTQFVESGVETPAENILRRLLLERQAELKKLLAEEKAEFQALQDDMSLIQSGKFTEEQLEKWCREIDEEENRKEQESLALAQWLKERELRKQEIERVWRPTKPAAVSGHKRKISDTNDTSLTENEVEESQQQQVMTVQNQETAKPALSPLLTSLLKSPSQAQNATNNSSILHSAITNQRPTSNVAVNPTIASLLNSSTEVAVSPGLQQLVSTAISGQQMNNIIDDDNQPLGTDILDDPNLPNLKIDDLANSILVQDGPLPEIKKEEVDDIISEIIENAQDIVSDPEQHLQIDGNGDININLELDDLEDNTVVEENEQKETSSEISQPNPEEPVKSDQVDPFEFHEDPVIFDSSLKTGSLPTTPKQELPKLISSHTTQEVVDETKTEQSADEKSDAIEGVKVQNNAVPGSVEIVEVLVMDEEENEKELNKTQIQDIVHSNNVDTETKEKLTIPGNVADEEKEQVKPVEEPESAKDKDSEAVQGITDVADIKTEVKKEDTKTEEKEVNDQTIPTNPTQNFSEELYDNLSMEVKIDKTGKVKRDYSRTRKKEDKEFDMLLAIEKAQLEENDFIDEILSDSANETDKADTKIKPKSDNERSSSPWTEEEDTSSSRGNRRRYSTPATPIDSLPNSPASSVACSEDDRDYRNWKKSVMLVYNRLASNKYASLFLKPITEDQAPGYSNIVYRPMDLHTIKRNIENGTIRTTLEFKRDVMLMFTNAFMYNKTNDTVYEMAKQMHQESINPIDILLQAQTQGTNTSLRRETRTSESGCKRKRSSVEENAKTKKRKED